VRALSHELLSALVINHPRHGIRKRTLLRVAGSLRANRIAMHHPTAAQTQALIKACAQSSHLRSRGGHHVRTTIGPAGQKRSILLKQNPILDQRMGQQQVSKTARRSPMFVSLHTYLEMKQDKMAQDDGLPCAQPHSRAHRHAMGDCRHRE
jgi:hypothetical protein